MPPDSEKSPPNTRVGGGFPSTSADVADRGKGNQQPQPHAGPGYRSEVAEVVEVASTFGVSRALASVAALGRRTARRLFVW